MPHISKTVGILVTVLLCLALVAGLYMLLLYEPSKTSFSDTQLGIRVTYPSTLDWDRLIEAPVLSQNRPYYLTLMDFDNHEFAIQLERIDPVEVYHVPPKCQPRLVQGPEATFDCMAANNVITPAYERFNNKQYDGVEIHGTLPPTDMTWPLVLLNMKDGDWLAIFISRWDGRKNAYALLEDIARSVKPIDS